MNFDSVRSDISEGCPNIDLKLPNTFNKTLNPSQASLPVIPGDQQDDMVNQKLGCGLNMRSSPLSRRKNVRGRGNEILKLRPTTVGRLFPNFATLFTIVKFFRLRNFYRSFENLKDYHFRVIRDAATDYHDDAENKEDKKNFKSIWTVKTYSPRKTLPHSKYSRKLTSFVMKTWRNHNIAGRLRILKLMLSSLLDKIPLFEPTLRINLFWDWFISGVLLLVLLLYSINRCFDVDILSYEKSTQMHTFLLIVIVLDILISLNSKIYLAGKPVSRRTKIISNYFKKSLIIDLAASLSSSLHILSLEDKAYNDFTLLLILKIFFSKSDLISRTKEIVVNENRHAEAVYDLLCLAVKILLSGHIIACLWHLTSYRYVQAYPDDNCWLKDKGILEKDWLEKYLYSIYWSVTTMLTVGYGDITSKNKAEMLFNICAMLYGCIIFCYSMNSIGDILKRRSSYDEEYDKKVKSFNKIMRGMNLSNQLEAKIKKYLEFVWDQEEKENPEQETSMMSKLSSSLRDEIFLETRVKALKTVPIFNKLFSDKNLVKLAHCMKKTRCSPEEFIFKSEAKDCSLYIIVEGRVDTIIGGDGKQSDSRLFRLESLCKGAFFGIHEFITSSPRRYGALAREFTTLYQITRPDFLAVIKEDIEEYEKFCNLKDLIMLNNSCIPLEIKCSSCGRLDHQALDCKFLNYLPNRLIVIKKHVHHKTHFHRKKKRNDVQKRNALMNMNSINQEVKDFLEYYEDDQDIKECLTFYDTMAESSSEENPLVEKPKQTDIPLKGDELSEEGLKEDEKSVIEEKTHRGIPKEDKLKTRSFFVPQKKPKEYPRQGVAGKEQAILKFIETALHIDTVHQFRFYFPNCNVEKVLRRIQQKQIQAKIQKYMSPKTYTKSSVFQNLI